MSVCHRKYSSEMSSFVVLCLCHVTPVPSIVPVSATASADSFSQYVPKSDQSICGDIHKTIIIVVVVVVVITINVIIIIITKNVARNGIEEASLCNVLGRFGLLLRHARRHVLHYPKRP